MIKYKFFFFRFFLCCISSFLLSRRVFNLNLSVSGRFAKDLTGIEQGMEELISHLYLSTTWILQLKNDPFGNIS